MYVVVKRRGSFFEPIPEAPSFADKAKAEQWARGFIEANPHRFQRGLETIEVRRDPTALNAQLGMAVDA
jgi:hypothetical protein